MSLNSTTSTRKLLITILALLLMIMMIPQMGSVHSQGSATEAPTMAATMAATEYTGTWDGTVVFGVPIALTGSLSKEGNLSREGYELWKEVYNKAGGIVIDGKHYQIETKYYDDTSNAQQSATLAEKLISEDKVNFLLGPYGTSANLQVSTVVEKHGIPMVEGNGVALSIFSQGYQFTFLVGSPAPNYLKGVIDMALAQDPKPATAAILSADDPFSVEVATAAQDYAKEKGLDVIYFQKYPDKSTDLRAPLTEAKGKNPDVFLNSGHFAESVALMQQAQELNFEAKLYAFSVGPSLPDFQTTLKSSANFVVGGAQWTPQLQYEGTDLFGNSENYRAMYNARWGHDPSYQSASSTASGIAFVMAIQAANSIDPQAVRDQLAKLDVMTFYGQLKFDERNVNIYKPMAVEQWQDGKKVTVWPADVANAKPMYPAPAWDKR
jgi:branched-chain amino acid transport system substrate-binding protein